MCLCVPYLLRGPLTDLRQTWWVYVGGPSICPWGVLFQKGQRLDGSTGHFHFPLYYICASLTPHAAMAPFAWQAAESNSAPFAALHVNGVRRWTSQLLLRGSFSKRSTGRRVNGPNGSTGQRVTFTFTVLYMIADDARLTPPRCKRHTASPCDDTRLTPHCCKKHTASFARSTGKFPSSYNKCMGHIQCDHILNVMDVRQVILRDLAWCVYYTLTVPSLTVYREPASPLH